MKLCPQCYNKSLNSAIQCECGHLFLDDSSHPAYAASQIPIESARIWVQSPERNRLMGPYSSIDEIKSKVTSGVFTGDYFMQRDGDSEWTRIDSLANFTSTPGSASKVPNEPYVSTDNPKFAQSIVPSGGLKKENITILRNSALYAAAGAIGCSIGTGAPIIIGFILFFIMFVVAHLLGFPWIKKAGR